MAKVIYGKFIKCRCCKKWNTVNYTTENQTVYKTCYVCGASNTFVSTKKDVCKKRIAKDQ